MDFQLLDIVEDDLSGPFDLILVRHLMYHLTMEDNLRVLEKVGKPYREGQRHYVLLSTHLKGNENERDYRWVN